jgi:16S rRNA (cytidine1402-2'-O)-methyltransferase
MAASSPPTGDDAPADGGANRRAAYRIGQTIFPARPIDPALYLVATPIGNLSDISLRGLETLASADVLACEDTRVTRVLLERYGIARRPFTYHEHNAADAGARLLEVLDRGESVALVSDAGTPLVSDPGYRLVESALKAGHRVIPIPGPSAPLAAIAASGLPTDSFFFAGFLPQKQKARQDRLEQLGRVPATLLFFESPHRLAQSLEDCVSIYGSERLAAVCRELTKAFEETRRGTLAELSAFYGAAASIKGEIVLLIGPPALEIETSPAEIETLLRALLEEHPPAKAATEAARITGRPRKELYQQLLALKTGDEARRP